MKGQSCHDPRDLRALLREGDRVRAAPVRSGRLRGARDSVLDLVRQFIHEVEEEDDKGRKTRQRFLIFPRYQQLGVVENIDKTSRRLKDALESGKTIIVTANVQDEIGGKTKAMIVTRSRQHAVRYKLAVDQYLAERSYPFNALVAFSGTVKDGGQEYTESGMNGFPETQTSRAGLSDRRATPLAQQPSQPLGEEAEAAHGRHRACRGAPWARRSRAL